MTRLYLIRHAEANSAIQGFIGDGGLSPLGILQAKRLRDRLAASKEIAADVLIASTLPRARQTAEIIAPALGLPVQLDDSLQELRPGEADGMPVEQFQARFGEPDYENDPYRIIAPGGESWAQFMLRVGSFLYFFKMSAWTLPPARFYTRNTSITLWQQLASGPYKPHWHLLKYNDAFHLHDIGTPVRIPWGQISASPASDQDRPSVPIESESFSAREPSSETNLSQEEK